MSEGRLHSGRPSLASAPSRLVTAPASPRMSLKIVTGILIVAATATAADWVWYTFGCQGMAAGLIHGAVLLTVLGGAVGAASGRIVRGLPIGTLAGIGGALTYYALVAVFGARAYGAGIPVA